MMAQLLAEDAEEKKAKGAAKSAKSAKSKKASKRRGEPAAATSLGTKLELKARDAGVEAAVEDSGEAQAALWESMPVAPLPTVRPAPVAPSIEARTTAPGPVDNRAAATPDERPAPASSIGAARGTGRGRGRGGQRAQSTTAITTGGDAVLGAVAHLLGQASLQVPAGSFDATVAALVTTAAPVALDRPQPPQLPAIVTSLADAQFSTGRPEAPESTIGGQTTCIACFVNPKSHVAVPCGHQCACGACSAQMQECPVCRGPVQMWMQVRVA